MLNYLQKVVMCEGIQICTYALPRAFLSDEPFNAATSSWHCCMYNSNTLTAVWYPKQHAIQL